jgi:hypothetical protein
MREKIEPYLLETVTKQTPEGTIYCCMPKAGIRIIPTGYFQTEQLAILAFYNALVAKNII